MEHVSKNGTFRDLKDAAVSVVLEQSRGHAYARRGRLMSARTHTQNIVTAPEPRRTATAMSRSGKRTVVVKAYDHEDSSSWSFSETEATKVCMKRELDSGKSC